MCLHILTAYRPCIWVSKLHSYKLGGQTSAGVMFASVVSYSEAHSDSCRLTTGVVLPGDKSVGSWSWPPPSYCIRSKDCWALPPFYHICDHRCSTVLQPHHKSSFFIVIHPWLCRLASWLWFLQTSVSQISDSMSCSNARLERLGNDACNFLSLGGVHFGTSGSQTIIIWLQSSGVTLIWVSSELL
jgi:hypothetical protein